MTKPKFKRVADEKRITEMWAFIATDDGGEGLPAVSMMVEGVPMMMPLVGADRERLASLRKAAQVVADRSGQPLKLVRFTQREELEVVAPSK